MKRNFDNFPKERSKSPIIKSYKEKKQTQNLNDRQQIQNTFGDAKSSSSRNFQTNPNSINKTQKSPLKPYDSAKDMMIRNKKQVETKQKLDPNKNEKLFNKIIFYQNEANSQNQDFRVEAFFNDGSSISWKDQNMVYLSSKAIKTRVNVVDVYRSQDLSFKFIKIIQKANKFNDTCTAVGQKLFQRIKDTIVGSKMYKGTQFMKRVSKQSIFKKYKIEEYYWEKCRINQTQIGYSIESNDQNAKLLLCHNLFVVKIEYLQLTKGRKIKGKGNCNSDDEDNVLDKYTFHPPTRIGDKKKTSQSQVWYQYQKVIKQFSIFNLPQRWFYPIDQIWTYLLANKIIKHDFIYIDFIEQDIQLKKSTHMPSYFVIGQKSNQNKDLGQCIRENTNLPLYGKPTHQEKCRWICFQQWDDVSGELKTKRIMWLNSESEQNLFYDGYGFWKSSSDGNSVLYKKLNSFDTIIKYNFTAIPFTIRIAQQPQRCLQSALSIFGVYIEHNKKLQSLEQYKQQVERMQNLNSKMEKNKDEVIFEENISQIGQLKVYGNGMVVGKFIDRVMLTLKGEVVTVIDDMGEQITLNINKKQQYADHTFDKNVRNPYIRFREHLRYISDIYQRVFHQNEWIRKQELIEGLNNLKIANEAFINVCENVKRI